MKSVEEELNNAIELFDEYGNCHRLSSILLLHKDELSPILREFTINLESFYNNLTTNNYNEIRNCADSLVDNISSIEEREISQTNSSVFEKYIYDNILLIKNAFIQKTNSLSFPLEISKWCADKGLYLQSVTIFVENIGSFLYESKLININEIDLDIKDKDMRKIIANIVNGSCIVSNECNVNKYSWIDWFSNKEQDSLDKLVFIGKNFQKCTDCNRYKFNTDNTETFWIKLHGMKKYKCSYCDLFSINDYFEKDLKWIFSYSKYIRDVRNALCHPEKVSNNNFNNLSITLVNNISYIIEKGQLSFRNFYDNKLKEDITYAIVDMETGDSINIDRSEIDLINLASGSDDVSYNSRIFSIWELENNMLRFCKIINDDEFCFDEFVIWLNDQGLYLDRDTLYYALFPNDISRLKHKHFSFFESLNSKMKRFTIVGDIVRLKEKKYIN